MMTSLCKESVHSFLGLTNTTHMDNNKDGLVLLATATDDDAYRSSTPPPPPPAPLFSLFSKKDPGGIGFIDDMGGGVDGLMSCTESLGFESSDERIDHQTAEMVAITNYNHPANKIGWRKDHYHHHHHHHHHQHVVKKFPPPLSSFNRNGQPSFFLRSVRIDGRLELTEVRTDRPEILRASRKDGRLRLHLIREDEDNNEVDIDSQHNDYEQDEETLEPEEQEEEEEETQEEEGEEEEEEEEEKGVEESKLEGLSRCNEMIGHQRHHQRHHHHHRHDHLHVWSHHCVPTR